MSCPEAIGSQIDLDRAPAAIVAASGFIWATSGHRQRPATGGAARCPNEPDGRDDPRPVRRSRSI